MSDGHDPRQGKRQIDLEEWCEELVVVLSKKGYLNETKPSVILKMLPDIREFARTVVQATRDGHFEETE